MSSNFKKMDVRISGTRCHSCEFLIEEKFKKIPGVEKASVSHSKGRARLYCSAEPTMSQLQASVGEDGYRVSSINAPPPEAPAGHSNTSRDYLHIGAIFLIVTGLFLILKRFDILPSLGISSNMSYGFIFVIGLVAAASTCIAVTGGLLIAVAAKYNEMRPELTGIQKLKPHLYFNAGRIISYTVLGAAMGKLGSFLTISTEASGVLTAVASIVMIVLGFQMLHLFPWMNRLMPKMPRFFARRITSMETRGTRLSAFMLGGGTFFLPCGFTQALQLYVLSKGDPVTGGLTMLFFSLGTLPALLSLSAISSFAKGAFQKYFIRIAGVVVVLLGFFNVRNGLALAGLSVNFASIFASESASLSGDTNVKYENGKQIVDMKVRGLEYYPSNFTVVKGVPVEWRIDGSGARGCGQAIAVPALNMVKFLDSGKITTISFTPKQAGFMRFSCTMGMTTPGAGFRIIEAAPAGQAPKSANGTAKNTSPAAAPSGINSAAPPACDPRFAECLRNL